MDISKAKLLQGSCAKKKLQPLKKYRFEGGSRVKNTSCAYLIEFFLTNLTIFVSSKNSQYFSRYRVGRAAKMTVFGPKSGLKSM